MIAKDDRPSLSELLASSPPHDIEVERIVIGQLLLKPTRTIFAMAAKILRADDFFDEPSRTCWSVIELAYNAGKPWDGALIASHLRTSGQLDGIGGAAFMRSLLDTAASPEHVEHYAATVKTKSVLRATIRIATDAVRDAFEFNGDDAGMVLQSLRARVDDALAESSDDDEVVTLEEAAQKRLQLLEHPEKSNLGKLVASGIDCIDSTYGGFRSGGSYVIAARPGNGKSALMKQIANQADLRQVPTLIVTSEMDDHEVAARILAERTGVDGKFFEVDESGECLMTAEQLRTVREAVGGTSASKMRLYSPTGRNASFPSIAATVRLMVAKFGVRIVAIDYLQLIVKSNPKQSDYEKVTEASQAAKQLARELGIVVLLLSQFNRENDKGGAKQKPRRPRLSDLRDSGSIEQDADGVIAMHRIEDEQPEFELIVLKWRNDAPGTFKVKLIGEFTKFEPRDDAESFEYGSSLAEWTT